MPKRPPARLLAACALAVASAASFAACGVTEAEEPHREGLALPLEGITYNVFITRQLNLQDVEDQGYTEGVPQAPPGSTYYGVFLEACNVSEESLETTDSFRIVDTAGNEFEPLHLEPENPFAYEPVTLEPDECIPADGSVASAAATSGALLVFEVPLESVENRPLELEVLAGFDAAEGEPEALAFELDI
jgi:hypothetical protein